MAVPAPVSMSIPIHLTWARSARRAQFAKTDVAVLDWAYRKGLILKEIAEHSPDILCMQELQGTAAGAGTDDHHAALRDELRRCGGYEGRYVRKMKRTGCGWPHTQIGNALMWRAETFE